MCELEINIKKRSPALGICLVAASGCLWTFFSLAEAEEIRYDSAKRRDPFQPLVGQHAYQGGLGLGEGVVALEGIVFDPVKGSYAVMGGAIYREGESIENAKLIKVFPDRVVLLQANDEMVIWLREEVLEAKQAKETTNDER